jgi:hypothetical protein
MANLGNSFRDAVTEYIKSWDEPLEVLQEVNVGYRFVKTPRKLDIVVHNTENNKFMAIECKLQLTPGSAYEKFSYALDDCLASPIPTIMVFAGEHIRDDMKSKLIMSGHGIEVEYKQIDEDTYKLDDFKNLMKQRCYMELGLNWFPFATGDHMEEQIKRLTKEKYSIVQKMMKRERND